MKYLLLFSLCTVSAWAGALDYDDLAKAEYSRTDMADVGAIYQYFITPSGKSFDLEISQIGNRTFLHIHFKDEVTLDVRRDDRLASALRSALKSYLLSRDRNPRATVDVCSSLCAIDEPSLPPSSLNWLGSRGKVEKPELGSLCPQ